MNKKETALLISSNESLELVIRQELVKKDYNICEASSLTAAYGLIYSSPPDVIITTSDIDGWENFVKQVKTDSVFRHIPFLIINERDSINADIALLPVDDWLCSDEVMEQLLIRINFRKNHTERYLDANPLTRLPGNFSIIAQLQDRIDSKNSFGLGYVDIDNFKTFNDCYGFARGDDIIRITARIITNILKETDAANNFTGHVGGDDFVFICQPANLKIFCTKIIKSFDLVSANFANEEDRKKGFIESEDRQGIIRKFPLPSLSIAAIDTRTTRIDHPGEASSISGDLKKAVKKLPGSNYLIDRRSNK